MAVTADQLIERADDCRTPGLVAAATTLYSGTLVFVNSSGYFDDDTATGTNKFAGIAVTKFDNSGGANGDVKAEVHNRGLFKLTGSGFAQSSVDKPVFATDNYTLTLTAGGSGVLVGVVREYLSSTEVLVELITDRAARQGAYTQTYATADKTHAAATAAALTAATGTADGTVDDVGAAFNQATLNNNFKECATQINATIVDLTDLKQLVNAIIDDLQAVGLVG